ncbi:hypothetical protein EV426DRAFT_709652 [Tirmania nivea]|nr:hypothetical protein EV426DRAFT_709652 [Tirmania nivea]
MATFNNNSLHLKIASNGPITVKNIKIHTSSFGSESHWNNNTTVPSFTGTVRKVDVGFNNGTSTTLTLRNTKSFLSSSALTVTSTGHGQSFKIFITDNRGESVIFE